MIDVSPILSLIFDATQALVLIGLAVVGNVYLALKLYRLVRSMI